MPPALDVLRKRRCTSCSASSAIRSARSSGDRGEPRLRHGACAQGLSLRPVDRHEATAGGAGLPRGRGGACRRRSASAAMSRRSAISLQGRWHEAGRVLEDVAIENPRDALALQAGHQIDFFTGNSRMLRDRIARALPAWSADMPGYHAMLGMQAFGLEEIGDYAARRSAGPRGGRARAARRLGAACGRPCHGDAGPAARRHRLDARQPGRLDEATASCRSTIGGISRCSTTISARSTRCWRCSTGRSTATRSTLALNMVDASALLWRLHLGGVDVGDRWARARRQLGAEGRAPATTPSTTRTR